MYTPSPKGWRMSDVLPGWFRLQHKNGSFMDFNPNDVQHMALYAYYKTNPDWQIVSLDGDEDTEPIEPVND